MSLDKLFNPQSIAIVGASQERGKVGNVITKNILELGYAGKIFFVNPKHEKLFDHRTFKSLTDITEKVDLAIIVLPAKIVVPVIREASERIKNFVVISAGFSETDAEGKAREEELKILAQEKDLNILGPNCLGFIIPKLKLNASFAGGMPQIGNISFVSQSGALAVAIMDRAKSRKLEFSNIISVGNKMQIDETLLLEYLVEDETTDVISMYLENIKQGKEFIDIARKTSEKKPVIVLKAGRSEKAKEAILSHTGALAGSDEILEEVFKKTGVIRADDIDQFFALTSIASNKSFLKMKSLGSVAVVTNAGGVGVLTADAFEGKGIKLAEIGNETRDELKSFLPDESSVGNPVDLLGDAREDRYEKALAILEKDDSVGTILCLLTPQDQTPVRKIAEVITRASKNSQKFIMTSFVGGEKIKDSVKYLREQGVVNLAFPDLAVRSLDKVYAWNENRKEAVAESKEFAPDGAREEKVAEIIAQVRQEKRTALSFSEASEVVKSYGIATPVVNNLTTDDALPEIAKFPVVMKVDSDKVLHKTDKQGVILNIKNQEELQYAQAQMKANFPGENLIIQEMLSIKTELIMGIKQDSIFGPIVVYGLGGIYTEVFKMVNFLVPPLDLAEIKKSLQKSKIKFLFEETRGQKAHNIDEMAQMLLGVSELAQEIAEIKELDINPVLIYNDGKSAVVVDVKIIV